MEQAGVPVDRMICVGGGERVDLGHGVFVSVYPSQHSLRVVADADDAVRRGVPRRPRRHLAGARAADAAADLLPDDRTRPGRDGAPAGLDAGGHSERGDGGALRLPVRDARRHAAVPGHVGPLERDDGRASPPDVAILAAAGRANIDGEPIQGSLADFVADQAAVLGARRVVLGHHDDWLPGFSVATDLAPIRAAIAERAPACELLEPGYLAGTPIFAGLTAPAG